MRWCVPSILASGTLTNMDIRPTARAVDQPDLISTSEAADKLNISLSLLRSLIRSGDVGAYQFGRALRVDRASVEDYLERSRVKP